MNSHQLLQTTNRQQNNLTTTGHSDVTTTDHTCTHNHRLLFLPRSANNGLGSFSSLLLIISFSILLPSNQCRSLYSTYHLRFSLTMLSDDDEHDELVNDINSKAHLRPPTANSHGNNNTTTRPHVTTSRSPHPIPFYPTSPFPLSTSLPLPPPPPSPSADCDVDELYLFLHKLDRKALTLLCSPTCGTSESSFDALQLAVQILFHSLECKRSVYGIDSVVCLSHAELLIQLLNTTAMACVQQLQEKYGLDRSTTVSEKEQRRGVKQLRKSFRALPLEWLKEAEQLCVAYPQLLAAHILTLNHLACCYRLINKPRTAIRLLQEALRRATEDGELQQAGQAEETKEAVEVADNASAAARLYTRAVLSANLCAVLCQMECWERAGLHAKLAVDLCQQHTLKLTLAVSAEPESPPASQSQLPDALSLLAHCYGALGTVELELHVPSCLHWFEKAQAVEESSQSNGEERKAVVKQWAAVIADVKQLMEFKEAERRREREMMRVHRPWKLSKSGATRPRSRISNTE